MDSSILSEYGDLYGEIMDLARERENLLDDVPVGTSHCGEAVRGGRYADSVGSTVLHLEQLDKRLELQMERLLALRALVEAALSDLPCMQRRVLRLRYMQSLSWNQVTQLVFARYDDLDERFESYLRRCHRIHAQAIAELEQRGEIRPMQKAKKAC